jgi:hypothetical protein
MGSYNQLTGAASTLAGSCRVAWIGRLHPFKLTLNGEECARSSVLKEFTASRLTLQVEGNLEWFTKG